MPLLYRGLIIDFFSCQRASTRCQTQIIQICQWFSEYYCKLSDPIVSKFMNVLWFICVKMFQDLKNLLIIKVRIIKIYCEIGRKNKINRSFTVRLCKNRWEKFIKMFSFFVIIVYICLCFRVSEWSWGWGLWSLIFSYIFPKPFWATLSRYNNRRFKCLTIWPKNPSCSISCSYISYPWLSASYFNMLRPLIIFFC